MFGQKNKLKLICTCFSYLAISVVGQETDANSFNFCGKLGGIRNFNFQKLSRRDVTLGLVSYKMQHAGDCMQSIVIEGERDPWDLVLQACANPKDDSLVRFFYNVTYRCTSAPEGVVRDVVDAAVNLTSQIVLFTDVHDPQMLDEETFADPVTLRMTPLNNTGQCKDNEKGVGIGKVSDLLSLGISLYKVTLQPYCKYGVQLKDEFAVNRMVVSACEDKVFAEDYRVRFNIESFCVVLGTLSFGQGYVRNDTVDILITRYPPAAYWVDYITSTFSLDDSQM
eukprot:TRINITY_DN18033_c0_g1_i3.p2 TRINITY_DN18033_c0_g1~~TRINITY_DN18033_c0_g1_i3.p2  ORF type:complete len:281 (+),score=24.88 TRINITY_DN18033_c0_g1_i3:215-1057(+)